MQIAEAFGQGVEGLAELDRDLGLRPVPLFGGHNEPAGRQVGPVETGGQLDQHGIALDADALEDRLDGFGDGGVDLEPRWLEPLPPLAQVEEPEHSGPLETLAMMRIALRGYARHVSGPGEGPVAYDEHPTAHADRERGRDRAWRGRAGTWSVGP